MSSISKAPKRVPRPVCVTKYYLITHFKVTYKVLWRNVITHELLEGWGYDYYRDVKPKRTLDPVLTAYIYDHFKMGWFESSGAPIVEETTGNRAPDDNI